MDMKNSILYEVKLIMDWDENKLNTWYITPNINFNDMSPKDMVEYNYGSYLLNYIKNIND